MKNKIVVGFDQSYTDTGISVVFNGELKASTHCYLDKYRLNTNKRRELIRKANDVFTMVQKMQKKYDAEVLVLVERVRLRSQGFISKDVIVAAGSLIALIVDVAYDYDYRVWSVDTRSWKAQVIGTASPEANDYGIDPKKWPTIKWCLAKGYDKYIVDFDVGKRTKGIITDGDTKYTYNDNVADSIGIAFYGFAANQKLEAEY